MRIVLLSALALVAACGSKPASVKLQGEDQLVHTLDAVTLPQLVVLDAEGAPIEKAPEATWTVSPSDGARIEGGSLVPLKDGTVTVTVALGELTDAWELNVSLPDTVAVVGPEGPRMVPVGASTQLAAVVLADQVELRDQAVAWSGGDPAVAVVDASGLVTAVAAGTTEARATSGELSATVQIVVSEPEAVLAETEAPAAE